MENRLNPLLDLERGFYLEKWFVEPDLCRVSGQGKEVRVEPKVMDVLVLLVLNQNRVLRKDEIIGNIWGEVNVVENVLARAISEIRKIFGDDAKNQSIIQTIPKVGYRLIAKISQGAEIEEELNDFDIPVLEMPAGAYSAEFNNRPFWRRGRRAGVAVILAIAVLLLLAASMSVMFKRQVEIKKIILLKPAERPNS